MNIGIVVIGIIKYIFDLSKTEIIMPLVELVGAVALSPKLIENMGFINTLFPIVQNIAAALLILNTTWQGFKAMFIGLGWEAEEPVKIASKAFVAGFLIYYIKDILMKIVELCNGFITLITKTDPINGKEIANLALGIINGPSVLYLILGVFVTVKIIGLMFKMFKRLAICALLLLCSPLAVASMVSKTTEGFMQGFIKLFIGNIAIQLIQSMAVAAYFVTMKEGILGKEFGHDFFAIMLTVALLTITDHLEDILRDISISVGLNRDMQGALGKIQGAAHTVSMLQGAGKFIKG